MVKKRGPTRSDPANKLSLVAAAPAIDKRRNNVLRRLLVLAAFRKNVNPVAKPISNLLATAYRASHAPHSSVPEYFNVDRVNSYLGKMKGGNLEVSFPRGEVEANAYLEALNIIFFGDDKSSHIESFDIELSDVELWKQSGHLVDEFLRADMSEFAEKGSTILVSFDSADPCDLDAQITHLRRSPGALSSHLLYHNPKAALLWEKIKQANSYAAHYMHCQTGLQALLSQSYLRERVSQSRIVFNLGAGSYSKDVLILRAMQELSRDRPAADRSIYCWVDASLAMLYRTWKNLPSTDFPSVTRVAMAADFEQPANIQSLYNGNGNRWPAYGSKKIYFILGFTVSTLREDAFFEEYSKHCNQGDVLVFSIQFIPEICRANIAELDRFKRAVLSNYDFPDGWTLAAAGLSLSERFVVKGPAKPQIEECSLRTGGEHTSLRLSFKANLEQASGPPASFDVTTAETFRHFELPYRDLLQRHGFVVKAEAKGGDNVKTLAVEFVGVA